MIIKKPHPVSLSLLRRRTKG